MRNKLLRLNTSVVKYLQDNTSDGDFTNTRNIQSMKSSFESSVKNSTIYNTWINSYFAYAIGGVTVATDGVTFGGVGVTFGGDTVTW